MRHAIIIAAASALLLTALPAQAAPEMAAAATAQSDELSAASKRGRHVYRDGRRYGWDYGYRRPYRSFAADPSFDPYGRSYRPNFYSPCTIDLGYGRFTRCDR